MRSFVLMLAAALMACGMAWAELSPEKAKEVQELIKQLSAGDFAVREAATKKLTGMDLEVLPLLRKTAAETTDAEVKTRCTLAADAIEENCLLGGTRVSLDVKDTPLSEVMATLAKLSGNKAIPVDGVIGDKKVTVKVDNVLYWEAVNAACKAAGAYYPMAGGDKGTALRLEERPEGLLESGMVVGPASIRLGELKRKGHELSYRVEAFTEDKTRVFGSLQVQKIADEAAKSQLRIPVGTAYGVGVMIGEMAEGPVKFEGMLELYSVMDWKEEKIEDFFGKEGAIIGEGEGMKLTFDRILRKDDIVTVMFHVQGGLADMMRAPRAAKETYKLSLVDPEGKRFESAGTAMMATGQGQEFFTKVPDKDGRWTMVWSYPGRSIKKSYAFTVEVAPTP